MHTCLAVLLTLHVKLIRRTLFYRDELYPASPEFDEAETDDALSVVVLTNEIARNHIACIVLWCASHPWLPKCAWIGKEVLVVGEIGCLCAIVLGVEQIHLRDEDMIWVFGMSLCGMWGWLMRHDGCCSASVWARKENASFLWQNWIPKDEMIVELQSVMQDAKLIFAF